MADKNLSGILQAGTVIKDNRMSFEDPMRLMGGEYDIELVSKSSLTVGKDAKIRGDIKVSHVIVHGYVEGTITECDLLEFHETAHVRADIEYKKLDVKPGAVFEGKATVIRNEKKGQ